MILTNTAGQFRELSGQSGVFTCSENFNFKASVLICHGLHLPVPIHKGEYTLDALEDTDSFLLREETYLNQLNLSNLIFGVVWRNLLLQISQHYNITPLTSTLNFPK